MDNYLDIEDAIQEFIESCTTRGLAQRTIICYHSHLRIWKAFIDQRGIKDFSQLTKQNLIDYRHHLYSSYRCPRGRALSLKSQGQKITALREFLNFAVSTGKALYNGSYELKSPKIPKTLPKNIPTQQQVKKLLNAPNAKTLTGYRDLVILELFYSTGARRKEVAGIQMEDCFLQEKCLLIREGKGNTQRWVPLGKQVCSVLREYITNIRPALMKEQKHDYLIVGDKGGPIHLNRLNEITKKYFTKIGLKGTCHSLRHSCATHMLKGKANLRAIQAILGHKSLETTQLYTHVDISDLTKAIEKSHPRENMLCDEN